MPSKIGGRKQITSIASPPAHSIDRRRAITARSSHRPRQIAPPSDQADRVRDRSLLRERFPVAGTLGDRDRVHTTGKASPIADEPRGYRLIQCDVPADAVAGAIRCGKIASGYGARTTAADWPPRASPVSRGWA